MFIFTLKFLMDINYSIQQQFFRPAPARGPSRFCPHPKGRWYIYIICYVAHSKYYVLHYFQNIYVTCHITASLLQMLSTARLLHQMNKIIKSLMKKKKIKKSMLRALDKQFRWLPLPTLLKLLMQALLDSGWIACISPHYLQVLDAAHMLPKNQAE